MGEFYDKSTFKALPKRVVEEEAFPYKLIGGVFFVVEIVGSINQWLLWFLGSFFRIGYLPGITSLGVEWSLKRILGVVFVVVIGSLCLIYLCCVTKPS